SAHVSAADFHLAQLSRLLLPTLTTRSCMHAVLQAEESHGIGGRISCFKGKFSPPGKPGAAEPDEAEPRAAELGAVEPGAAAPGTVGGQEANGGGGGDGGAPAAAVAAMAAKAARVAAAAGQGTAVLDDGAWLDMWTSLVAVLEATEEQQTAMRKQSGAIADLAKELEGTTEIMDRLKVLLIDRNQTLEGEMAEIQTAKFVLWVSKNKACVHMLNQLWDKLHGDPPAG
ncbi:unnamed protein product, partial [Laminaria digitata]